MSHLKTHLAAVVFGVTCTVVASLGFIGNHSPTHERIMSIEVKQIANVNQEDLGFSFTVSVLLMHATHLHAIGKV